MHWVERVLCCAVAWTLTSGLLVLGQVVGEQGVPPLPRVNTEQVINELNGGTTGITTPPGHREM